MANTSAIATDSRLHALIWEKRGDDYTTRWVTTTGEVSATRPEVVVAVQDRLLAWRSQMTDGDEPCAGNCVEGTIDGRCPPPGFEGEWETGSASSAVEHIDLVDIASGEVVARVSKPPSDDAETRTVELLGSVGPYLFVFDHDRRHPCGTAHGWGNASFYTFDADTMSHVNILREFDVATKVNEMSARLRAQAEAEEPEWDHDEDDFTVELTMVIPVFTADAHLSFTCQLTRQSSYGNSDNLWGSYTESERSECPRSPRRFTEFEAAPTAVAGYWARHPRASVTGWSMVDVAAEGSRELFAAFESAPRADE